MVCVANVSTHGLPPKLMRLDIYGDIYVGESLNRKIFRKAPYKLVLNVSLAVRKDFLKITNH